MKVVILRDLSPQEIDEVAAMPEAEIHVSPEVSQALPFPVHPIDLDLRQVFQEAFDLSLDFPHRTYGTKKVAEHLSYRGYSLWYYTKYIFFNRFKLAYRDLKLYESVVSDGAAALVYTSSKYLSHPGLLENARTGPVSPPGALNKMQFALLFVLHTLIGLFFNFRLKKARHLFLYPPVKPQPILDKEQFRVIKGNPPVQYYLDDLVKREDGLILEESYPFKEADLALSRRNLLGNLRGRTVFLEPFLVRALLFKGAYQDFKSQRKKEQGHFDKWIAEENDGGLKMMLIIARSLGALRAAAVLRIKAAEILFEKSDIRSFGCIDENSIRVKSIFEVAKRKGIFTYALQHGAIYPQHLSYAYRSEDWNYTSHPDKTFVFGTHTRDVLINNNLPASSIEVSGQLRTDIIPGIKEKSLKVELEGLKPGAKTVLYTSQPLFGGEEELRDQLNLDFFRLSLAFPEYNFILKPHPRETDREYFHKLARQTGSTNYIISNSDLYLLLNTADVLLTYYSTVGAEAIYFDLPLIVMDYTHLDLAGYLADKVGIKAANFDELRAALVKVLESAWKPDAETYSLYKRKYAGEIDGKVAERILNSVLATSTP